MPFLDPADRIVVLWIGRLGDFLLATPFIHALRERFPKARITAIVGERGSEAARLCPDVDEVLTLRHAGHPLAGLRLAARLAAERCDLLVDLNSAFSRASTALAWLSRARVKVAFRKPTGNAVFTRTIDAPAETEHMLDRYARLAQAIGAPYEPRLRVRVSEAAALAGRRALYKALGTASPGSGPPSGDIVLIHPGNFKKFDNRWPEEKFVALTDRILDLPGVLPVYMAGPGEEKPVREIIARLKRPVPWLKPMSLGALAGALRHARLLIVNATGTAHLAAALDVPTFTFLSGYTKTVWMPKTGPHHFLVSSSWESCRDIGVDEAWAAISPLLARPAPAKSER